MPLDSTNPANDTSPSDTAHQTTTDSTQTDATQGPLQAQGASQASTASQQPSPASLQQPQSGSDTASRMVGNAQPTATAPDYANHPAVQRAGIVHAIAQSLAGGPRYQISIDAQTGQTTRTPVPVSGKQLSFAIALEALSGGLAGLSQTGPNHAAKAGLAGLQQGQQIQAQRQQQDQAQAQQASADYVRQAAIANTNFQTHQNALRLGQMEYDQHKQYVSDSAPVLDSLNQVGAIKAQGVHESELVPTYHVAKDMAVVDGIVPRMNPDGSQATNKDGSLAWDNTYSVIDPEAKIALPDSTAQLLAAHHVPGYYRIVDGQTVPITLPVNTQIKSRMVVDGLATASAIKITESSINQQLKAIPKEGDADARRFQVNLTQSLEDGTVTPKALKTFAKYTGMPLDQAFAQMYKDKVDPDTIGQLASLIPGDVRQTMKDQRTALEEKTKRDADTQAAVEREKALVGVRAQTAGAEERARQAAKPGTTVHADTLRTPDALGFTPTAPDLKTYNQRFNSFKRNADDLSRTEQSYGQFADVLNDINSGKDLTGAASVVALFNAVGLSGTALKGQGFRVSQPVLAEHTNARGWLQGLQAQVLKAKAGDIITPQQIKDYASIAANARRNQYVAVANQAHNAGISADPFLPTGNGQKIDANTASIFLALTGGDKDRARQAALKKGWQF